MGRLFEGDGTWERMHERKLRRSPRDRREDRAFAEFAAAAKAAEEKAARLTDREGTGDSVIDVDDL